mmetsp:Transcript_67589/g.220010  ORF Transcript_67589/g.220010 Transcript_67589/m.220010 type:complete len:321 (-) Transcript_67589:1952-2914(-)
MVLFVDPSCEASARTKEDAAGIRPMSSCAGSQNQGGVGNCEKKAGLVQLGLFVGGHAAGLRGDAGGVAERMVLSSELGRQTVQRACKQVFQLSTFLHGDGRRKSKAQHIPLRPDDHREHPSLFGEARLCELSIEPGTVLLEAGSGTGDRGRGLGVEGLLPMQAACQGLEEVPEDLVAIGIRRHRPDHFDHGVASVVDARLEAPREGDAAGGPARPQSRVDVWLLFKQRGEEAEVLRKIRQGLRALLRREAHDVLRPEARHAGMLELADGLAQRNAITGGRSHHGNRDPLARGLGTPRGAILGAVAHAVVAARRRRHARVS